MEALDSRAAAPTASPPAATPALLAKATLRRLAQARLEPTPENYARAWAEESGPRPAAPAAATNAGPAWAALIERLVGGLGRPGRQWTPARRKDSLHRVLQGSRSDADRLLQRLQALVAAWEGDHAGEAEALVDDASASAPPDSGAGHDTTAYRAAGSLAAALHSGLPASDGRAAVLADELSALAESLALGEATPRLLADLESLALRIQRWFGHRHASTEQLLALVREMSAGLVELAEDGSWVRGQCAQLAATLSEGPDLRALRAAGTLLADTRRAQRRARDERAQAREALTQLIASMLDEVGALGRHTGVFELAVVRHEEAIAGAQSLEGLADVVQAMLQDSRAVRAAVDATQQRLHTQQARAAELEARVRTLEAELRRSSDEAATDALTQVANRRGLEQAFAAESARATRSATPQLAVGLIDIDNFKKLNDRLGHAAGDVALRSLAAAVRERLRPVDHIARFGGEEFVILLPDTSAEAAQQALTRLQRSLSASLFLHEGEEVFVTFSAGVSAWRAGEALEAALERADQALYEAKRTGKNRTCLA
jgi:diguanylate cyclase